MVSQIGNTPFVYSEVLSGTYGCKVYIKEDFHNPGMSSKDRTALYMIRDAEMKGLIKKGGTLVEASSGNTGIGLALLARELGYQCHIFMSVSSSTEKVVLLRAYGAEVTLCENANGPKDPLSTQSRAAAYAEERPNSYYCNQYFNQANIDAHYFMTGPEIWRQSGCRIDHILVGVGTGGTISGIGRYFKKVHPQTQIYGVDPESSILTHYFQHRNLQYIPPTGYRIEGIGRTFLPGSLDFSVIDQFIQVDACESVGAAHRLRQASGHLCGFSSGAVLAALDKIARSGKVGQDEVVVLFFADHGSRYMSKLYNEEWLKKELNYIAEEQPMGHGRN